MPRYDDLTGMRFGRLVALHVVPNNSYHTRWHCICDCGNTKDILQQNLRNGHVRSCGCLLYETSKARIGEYNASIGRCKHGQTRTRLYREWVSIKSRCYNKTSSSYRNYGMRGIRMCDEWLHNYPAFRDWALSSGYADDLTIDRIDVNGNYEPANCRWVNMSVQVYNKRLSPKNSSGHRGVSYNKKMKKWVAYISKDTKFHYLGSFQTYDEAVTARENADLEFFGSV